jgi:hypothetical protein
MHNGQLVCYYSTQADPRYNQKLSHKTTNDLLHWSEQVDDVAQPDPSLRPGIATVAHSPISGNYVMIFEVCGVWGCPAYYKVSKSPLTFGSAGLQPVIPGDGQLNPGSSPFVIWTPEPGKNGESGIFIANGASREELFVNTDAVDPNGWKPVKVGQWAAHSRELRIINTHSDSAARGRQTLLITNGGNIGCSGSCYNFVANGVVDIPTYPQA